MRQVEDGWVALPRLRFWARFVQLFGDGRTAFWIISAPWVLQLATYIVRYFTEPEPWSTALLVFLTAAAFGSLIAGFLAQPLIEVRADGSAWRRRGRQRSPQELDRSLQFLREGRDQLWLGLLAGKRIRFSVPVRTAQPLDEHQLAAVIALLERAPIELPPKKQDPWDPNGRFAHLDRQGYLEAADAVALLRDPPAVGIAPNADQRKEPRKGGVDRYPWSS
ncbi:MAG: hypothetical protein ABW204_11310 [Microbacteriaceae bacterium]